MRRLVDVAPTDWLQSDSDRWLTKVCGLSWHIADAFKQYGGGGEALVSLAYETPREQDRVLRGEIGCK
jgi:hypothetical protein